MAGLGNLNRLMEALSGTINILMINLPPLFKIGHKLIVRLAPSTCVPSPRDQRVGGPHSSHPYGAARHEGHNYDQRYLQEVMSVDVHPNNYAYQTNEPYHTAEPEDRLIGLLQDFVDSHQEDVKRINLKLMEMEAKFEEKFDDLTNRLEHMVGTLVDIDNTLLNHQDDLQDQNTRIVNVGFVVDTVESHLNWNMEELEKKLTKSNKLSEWKSNQSCQEEDEFPKAQARYEEETKKEIGFLVEKG